VPSGELININKYYYIADADFGIRISAFLLHGQAGGQD
jgi:hypothetical protein